MTGMSPNLLHAVAELVSHRSAHLAGPQSLRVVDDASNGDKLFNAQKLTLSRLPFSSSVSEALSAGILLQLLLPQKLLI